MKVVRYFFQDVPEAGEKAFKRFYLPLTVAIAAALFSVILVYREKLYSSRIYQIENMVMVLFLGVPVLAALFLIAEHFKFDQKIKCLSGLFSLAVLMVYYFTLPEKFLYTDTSRYVLFAVSSLFFLFSFPFFLKSDRYFTRKHTLFLVERYVFASIVTLLIYAGTSFAVYAIQILFIPKWYDSFRLTTSILIVSAGVLSPWIVLAGIPETDKLNDVEIKEKTISILSKFIFIPVVLFYLAILYLYFFKVLFFEELPKGLTSYLILSFCGAGTLVYIFILEESKNAGKGVTVFFEKWFFRTVLPLLLLLWYAIYKRTGNYGITERRYFLIVLAGLLTIWTLYFIISKKKNIIIIPIMIVAGSLFISFGPWGVFETSFRSQKNRLVKILNENGLIENGVIITAKNEVSFEERKNISSILLYVEARWGLERLKDMIPKEIALKKDDSTRYLSRYNYQNSNSMALMEWMGLKFVSEWETSVKSEYFSLHLEQRKEHLIEGPFDGALMFVSYPDHKNYHYEKEKEITLKKLDPKKIRAEITGDSRTLKIINDEKTVYESDLFKIISDLLEPLEDARRSLSPDKLMFTVQQDDFHFTILFHQAHGSLNKDGGVSLLNGVTLSIYYRLNNNNESEDLK